MKAVHFGAGNIGRGFVGQLLHQGGYQVVFSDVAAPLVEALQQAESYTVREVGDGGADHVISGFDAVNSAEDPERVAGEVAAAAVVTTAVGPTILRFVAPLVVAGLRRRDPQTAPLQVMACENAIGGTDQLRQHMADVAGEDWAELEARAVFANTAVDRIVPGGGPAGDGAADIDVEVEPFYEWTIERGPFGEDLPQIPGAHFVEDLAPYIERKLFTVNTGHAAAAYLGARAGMRTIAEALSDEQVAAGVSAALAETSALLAVEHGFAEEDLSEYRATILGRFRNPALPDTVERVGRQPLRKLSRHERFIGPAAEAAARGLDTRALIEAVGAALVFRSEDEQAVRMQQMLGEMEPRAFVAEVTGLTEEDALYEPVLAQVRRRMEGAA